MSGSKLATVRCVKCGAYRLGADAPCLCGEERATFWRAAHAESKRLERDGTSQATLFVGIDDNPGQALLPGLD